MIRLRAGTAPRSLRLDAAPSSHTSGRAVGLHDQSQDLDGRDRHDAEHQVAHHLRVTPHPHGLSAVIVLEIGVDPFRARPPVVADVLRQPMADHGQTLSLSRQISLETGSGPRVHGDDRDMAEGPAVVPDLGGIIGAVHEVVEARDPARRQGRQRDRHLAVVHRGGGQNAGDRDVAVGGVDVQLVAGPTGLEPLGVALDAGVAAARQVGQHGVEAHGPLTLKPARLPGRRGLALARSPTPATRRRRSGFGQRCAARRRFPRHDGGAVAGDVADEPLRLVLSDQRLVQARRHLAGGELAEGTREGRLARNLAEPGPAAQAPQRSIPLQALDQRARRGQVEHRLGHEGPRQSGAFGQGTARPPVTVNHGALDTCHLQHGRELPVQRRQRTDGVVEKRQQFALYGSPLCG